MSRCRWCSRDLSLLPHSDNCRYAGHIPKYRRVTTSLTRAKMRAAAEQEDYHVREWGTNGSERFAFARARLAEADERRSAELAADPRCYRPDPDEGP